MRKSEIFTSVIDIVAEVCEVRPESVVKDLKFQAVVDARYIAVKILRRLGLDNEDIALVVLRRQRGEICFPSEVELRNKARSVAAMYMGYDTRFEQSFAFREMSREADRLANDRLAR